MVQLLASSSRQEEAAPVTGQVPPGHTVRNDGTHGAASPILRPRFVGRHPIQRFSLDGGSASAVAVDPYLGSELSAAELRLIPSLIPGRDKGAAGAPMEAESQLSN